MSRHLKPYDRYKDSGVEWLGEVPEHWETVPFFSTLSKRFERNDQEIKDRILSLSYGSIIVKDPDEVGGLVPESYDTYQVAHPGDIVLRLTDLQNDKHSLRTGLVETQGAITSAYVVVVPRECPEYFGYFLHMMDIKKLFYGYGAGVRQTMKYADLKHIPITKPPLPEQKAIAAYLDSETSRIDTLISEQRDLIELLKEKRQALISHCVTKGLNPDVPMKDSEVQWLGEIPQHWNRTRLKHITDLIVDCPHETPTYAPDGDFFVIRTADIERGAFDESEMYRVDQYEYERRIRRACLDAKDIVYGREGERWGHAALVPETGKFCLGQRMMQFRPIGEVDPAFLMWELNSTNVYNQGSVDTVGATAPHVNVATIREYRLSLPPLPEQKQIADYLDRETTRIDALITEAEETIDLMKEHRSALISAAVTGKAKVPGVDEAM